MPDPATLVDLDRYPVLDPDGSGAPIVVLQPGFPVVPFTPWESAWNPFYRPA